MSFPIKSTSSRVRLMASAAAVGLAVTMAACGSSSDSAEGAEWAPPGDVEWIVPYSAGGGFDVYSRGIAQALEEAGYLPDGNVVIRNTTPLPQGLTTLFAARGDGSTIGILPMPAAAAQEIQAPNVAHWETGEFTVLGQVDENAYVIYVPSDSPYEKVEDLIAAEGLRTVTVEEGASSALAGLAAIESLGLDASVTYGAEGSAEVVTAALRGDADFFVYGSTDVVGYVESGDVRPLLFLGTDEQRPPEFTWLEDVPGAADAGYPDLAGAVTELRVIVGPPDMDERAAQYLRDAIYDVMTSEAFAAWAEQADRPIVPRDATDAEAGVRLQIEQMQELVPALTEG